MGFASGVPEGRRVLSERLDLGRPNIVTSWKVLAGHSQARNSVQDAGRSRLLLCVFINKCTWLADAMEKLLWTQSCSSTLIHTGGKKCRGWTWREKQPLAKFSNVSFIVFYLKFFVKQKAKNKNFCRSTDNCLLICLLVFFKFNHEILAS